MAFVSAVTSIAESNIVGNWYRAEGTFGMGGDTEGTVDTGLSKVLFHSVHITTGTVTSQLKEKANVTHAPAASNGKIGIIAAANDIVGTWEAIGVR